MTPVTDLEPSAEPRLCRRAAHGDTEARRALYAAHAGGIMTMAMRLLYERAAAEDVVQDTFLKAFEKLHTFSGKARFGTWLRRIAINECLQRLRSPWHTRGQAYEDAAEHAGAPPGCTDDQIDLLRALGTLDGVSRTVVWLHDVEGFKHREIADLLGRSVSFSKSRLARAHRSLRMALESGDGLASSSPCQRSQADSGDLAAVDSSEGPCTAGHLALTCDETSHAS